MAAPAPILLLYGEDTYSLKAAEDALIAQIVDPGFQAMNLNVLDGPSTAPSQVVSAAATMPFGPGGRLVLVKDCPYFSAGKYEGSEEVDVLTELFDKGLPPGCHLAFSVPRGIDKRLKVTAAAVKKVTLREFPAAKPWDNESIVVWLVGQARETGAKLGNDVAAMLVNSLGTDRYKLRNELDKLAAYAAGEPITPDIVALLAAPGETDVFEMLESVARRKPLEAVARLRKMLVTEAALKVLATMATLMRGWLTVKLHAERGLGADAIAQAMGARSSFKIKKDLELCRGWSSSQLSQALGLLLEVDSALKSASGRSFEALQLEQLLVKLSLLH